MLFKRTVLALAVLTISGCSLLQQPPREVEIITKPIKVDIVQPILPRPIKLKEPKWYVKSLPKTSKIKGGDKTFVDKDVGDLMIEDGVELI